MANPLNLQVTVDVPLAEGLAGEIRERPPRLCHVVGRKGRPVGKAVVDNDGRALLKLAVSGTVPPNLEISVSPLSVPVEIRRVKKETGIVSHWDQNEQGLFTAAVTVNLSSVFFSGVDWLHEPFTVRGVLVNRYLNPATSAVIETPIPLAKVKLYDVDIKKSSSGTGCMVCFPAVTVCRPATQVCVPQMACEPIQHQCVPEMACVPSIIGPGTCAPHVEGGCAPGVIFDPGEIVRRLEGCCGAVEAPAALGSSTMTTKSGVMSAYGSVKSAPFLPSDPGDPGHCPRTFLAVREASTGHRMRYEFLRGVRFRFHPRRLFRGGGGHHPHRGRRLGRVARSALRSAPVERR